MSSTNLEKQAETTEKSEAKQTPTLNKRLNSLVDSNGADKPR